MIDNEFSGVWPVCSGDLFICRNNEADGGLKRAFFILKSDIIDHNLYNQITYAIIADMRFKIYVNAYPGVFYRDQWYRISLNETKRV